MNLDDLELQRRALKACGYRVHDKQVNGTRWLMAVKGLEVQYKHWHPLTNISQAMQLLKDCPQDLRLGCTKRAVYLHTSDQYDDEPPIAACEGADLIAAQCRAIVTACASLEPVR